MIVSGHRTACCLYSVAYIIAISIRITGGNTRRIATCRGILLAEAGRWNIRDVALGDDDGTDTGKLRFMPLFFAVPDYDRWGFGRA